MDDATIPYNLHPAQLTPQLLYDVISNKLLFVFIRCENLIFVNENK